MAADSKAPCGSQPFIGGCTDINPKDLILTIAQALVENPEQVSFNEVDGAETVVYEITVAKSDMGEVIGKEGRNAVAIRTILNAMAGKTHKKLRLEIIE